MYKISEKLNEAISSIFSNPEEGFLALGSLKTDLGLPQEEPLSTDIDPLTRIAMLRKKLEGWIELYGLEVQEFDSEYDTLRISSEAKALLLALREIQRCFPEVETAT